MIPKTSRGKGSSETGQEHVPGTWWATTAQSPWKPHTRTPCEGQGSWGIDPPAPSVLRGGLPQHQFPSTWPIPCEGRAVTEIPLPERGRCWPLAGRQAAGKEQVQPKGLGVGGTPASAARPGSVCPRGLPMPGWETGKSVRTTKASSVQTHLSWVAPRLGSHLPVLPRKLGPGALCSQMEKLTGSQGEVHGAGTPPLLKDPQASVPPSSSTLPLPSPPWA